MNGLSEKDRRKIIFGRRLKQVITERGYTQRGLAAEIGTTDKTISSYIHGQTNPPVAAIVEISKELNITSDFLLGLSNEIKELENTDNPINEEMLVIRQAYTAMSDVQRDAFTAFIKSVV